MHVLASLEQNSLLVWIRESGSLFAFPGILLLHTDHLEAVRIAERVRAAVRRLEFRLEPGPSPKLVTISAGTVSFPRDGQTSSTLLSRAEKYLQAARQRGGDSVVHSNDL